MQNLYTDGPSDGLGLELQHLKRATRQLQRLIIGLGTSVVVLFVVLVAVAASQGVQLRSLNNRKGLLPHPNVAISTSTGNRNLDGLTYGGSLFRGSGFWASKPALPNKLADHAAIGVDPDESVYIIGGSLADGNVTNQVWKYSAIFRNYKLVSPMPEPRYRFGAALIGRKIYVVGGRNSSQDVDASLVKSTFVYDIDKDVWTRAADQNDYHGDTCAASLDNKLYMVGGYGLNYAYLQSMEGYDPATDKWTLYPNMPTARGDLMCTAFDNEIFVLGGYSDDGFSSKMESYNPKTDIWTTRPNLLTPRGDAGIVVLPGNKLMLVGGEGHYLNNDTLKYPKHVNEIFFGGVDQTWVQKAMIPTPRFRTAAATTGGLAFLFGGADVCLDRDVCPEQDSNEAFLDVDHPHVYVYLKNDPGYNDNSVLTTYPV